MAVEGVSDQEFVAFLFPSFWTHLTFTDESLPNCILPIWSKSVAISVLKISLRAHCSEVQYGVSKVKFIKYCFPWFLSWLFLKTLRTHKAKRKLTFKLAFKNVFFSENIFGPFGSLKLKKLLRFGYNVSLNHCKILKPKIVVTNKGFSKPKHALRGNQFI